MILFRAAHKSEAATIASLSRLHVEYGLRWRWTPAKVRSHIDNPETMVLVASKDGSLAGFAIMKFDDTKSHLMLFAVDPAARREGIGRSMMQWLEKSCVTAGIRRIQLEVRSGNKIARHFYHGLGYRHLGQIATYYDHHEAATILGKSLIAVDQMTGPTSD
jgi:ribosomal-protein-alanine N-acetyltransferase